MKIIFLDIDGVLNDFKHPEMFIPIDLHGNRFETNLSKKAIVLVNELAERHNAQIVISSTWREFDKNISLIQFDPDVKTFDLRNFLKRMGMKAEFHKDWHTPLPEGKKLSWAPPRGVEVKKWLDAHPEVTHWVVLDDDRSFTAEQKKNCAFTNANLGLTFDDFLIANEILHGNSELIL